MKICPTCSNPIEEDAKFCGSCSRDLTVASAGLETSPTHAQPIQAKTSGMAVAGLILSIFSLPSFFVISVPLMSYNYLSVLGLIPGILGIVFGHAARARIKKSGGALTGKRIASIGAGIGYTLTAPFTILWILSAVSIGSSQHRQAEMRLNAASAVGSMRTLNLASNTYAMTYGRGFPPSLAALGPPLPGKPEDADGAGLIDEVLAGGRKSGYIFTYVVTANDEKGFPTAYTITAEPEKLGETGRKYFFTDKSGVIRQEQDHPANKDSPRLPD